MPTYKYRFCDGTVCDVEVSDEHYALLTAMDKQEQRNNRYQGRRNIQLEHYLRKEEKTVKKRDDDFKGANE